MTKVLTLARESSIGFKARRLRISQLLTQRQLAKMAGVSLELKPPDGPVLAIERTVPGRVSQYVNLH